MKKLLKGMLVVLFALNLVVTHGHVHDENCGYNPETGEGCIYEINPLWDDELPGK